MALQHRGTEGQSYTEKDFNDLTSSVIGAAIEVHRNWARVYWNQSMNIVWQKNSY